MVALILTLVVGLVAAPALAAGKTGKAGKSNTGHLYLYEKDPATWDIVEGGAWGKMEYKLSGSTFDFVFNGHDHHYYHTVRDDIHYVVTGGGGAPLYDIQTEGTVWQEGDVGFKEYHYCVCQIDEATDELTITVYQLDDTVKDTFTIDVLQPTTTTTTPTPTPTTTTTPTTTQPEFPMVMTVVILVGVLAVIVIVIWVLRKR